MAKRRSPAKNGCYEYGHWQIEEGKYPAGKWYARAYRDTKDGKGETYSREYYGSRVAAHRHLHEVLDAINLFHLKQEERGRANLRPRMPGRGKQHAKAKGKR